MVDMKIYTRGGDRGETSLPTGDRAPKDATRIHGYGALDELASLLGWLAAEPELPEEAHGWLGSLVALAMEAGGAVATGKGDLPPGMAGHPAALEAWIDTMEARLPALRNFILPMGTHASAACQVVRSQCRRIERVLVGVFREQPFPDWVLAWINRLADFLFVLARDCNRAGGQTDRPWRRQAAPPA